MTRLLDRFGPGLAGLRGGGLRDAVAASEGRVVLAETVAGAAPLLAGTANAELVAAFGADLVCLNLVDPSRDGVLVPGLEAVDPPPVGFAGLAALLARPVGCVLEPDLDTVEHPFRATAEQSAAAAERGAAFVLVTANPRRGATVADVAAAAATVRRAAPGLLCLAGKMHGAGAAEALGPATVEAIADAGADGFLVPLPGTAPGVGERLASDLVAAAHDRGLVVAGTIGTSQEGADPATLAALALCGKRIGVDIAHIGDAGVSGIAHPDNVYAYSVALRGVRHTWNRMARNHRASWGGIG
jgi:hypothetical protein